MTALFLRTNISPCSVVKVVQPSHDVNGNCDRPETHGVEGWVELRMTEILFSNNSDFQTLRSVKESGEPISGKGQDDRQTASENQ